MNIFNIVLPLSPRLLLLKETFDKSKPIPKLPMAFGVDALTSTPTLLEICRFL